jgi:hypothetical protein
MRIGLLTTYLAVGDETDSGIGQHFRILADALTTQGHEVEVFFLCDGETATVVRRTLAVLAPGWTCTVVTAPLPGWLMRVGARSWPFQMLLKHLALAWAGRQAVLARHQTGRFDVVETHSYNLPGLFLVSDRKRPPMLTRVSTTTGQMVAISPMRSRVLRWEAKLENFAIRQSDALVTHTRQHRDALGQQEGLDPARFAIVPHGIPDPGAPPPPAPNPAAGMEFLFVGRFEHRKGIDVLLAAIPLVAYACPTARFTLAGSTGDGHDWAKFAADHPGLLADSRVQSLGRVTSERLPALYRRCDVMVAPSRYESFGLIYVEAMSHAKPVIGCRAGGIPEVVTHGATGLLVAPGDVGALADSMIRLARDAGLRDRMGWAGRADFLARFSASTLAANSIKLYQRIAGQSNPPGPLC